MSNGLASKCLDTIKLGHGVASLWDHDLFLSFGEYVVITGLIEASVPEAVDDTALRGAVPSRLGHMKASRRPQGGPINRVVR